jgi:hypothetical protein
MLFLGIDVSKDKLDGAVVSEGTGAVLGRRSVPNTPAGIERLRGWAETIAGCPEPAAIRAIVEATCRLSRTRGPQPGGRRRAERVAQAPQHDEAAHVGWMLQAVEHRTAAFVEAAPTVPAAEATITQFRPTGSLARRSRGACRTVHRRLLRQSRTL